MIWAYAIVAVIALQRLAEVIYAQKNTRALLAKGGVEAAAAQYSFIVALHVAWLIAIVVFLPDPPTIYWLAIAVLVMCQILRVWVMAALGPYWTTRIITVAGAPLVRSGPYRFTRHPNYWVVVVEIAALPLAFGEVWVAAVFSILNAIVISLRMRAEDAALAPRRAG